ncbi:acyltransferase family protein [Modestobacter lacusdianchii]
MDRQQGRLELLDGLRFLAALSVVAFHFTARESPSWDGLAVPADLEWLGRWTVYGELGVPLFFIISGFVLLMTAWDRSVPSFIASRVGRLFPAYWVAVAFSMVLVLVLWPEQWPTLGRVITEPGALLNLTMVQTAFGAPDIDGPYWTLWYELRFYFLVVLLMLVGITRARVLAFATLWPIVAAVAQGSGSGLLTTVLMPEYACYFAGGMLLYLIRRDGHDLGTWLLVGLQCVIGVGISVPRYQDLHAADLTWGRSSLLLGVGIVACFGLVALVTLGPVAGRRFRGMGWLGALTYPLYLVHENLGWYVIHLLSDRTGPLAAVLLATVAALLAAVLVHHLVERPTAPRLRRVVTDMLLRGAAPAGTAQPSQTTALGMSTEDRAHRTALLPRVAHPVLPASRPHRQPVGAASAEDHPTVHLRGRAPQPADPVRG